MSETHEASAPSGLIAKGLLAKTAQRDNLIETWERAATNLPRGTRWEVLFEHASTTLGAASFFHTTQSIVGQPYRWAAVGRHSVPQTGTSPEPRTLLRFRLILDQWKGLLVPRHYDAMRAHIERLLGDEDELKEEGITPSIGSFDDLLMFLASRPWTKPPAIGLDKRGCFALSWAPARQVKADLTLTFLGNGSVRWYIYDARDRARPALSATGVSRRDEMPGILAAFGCDAWAAA